MAELEPFKERGTEQNPKTVQAKDVLEAIAEGRDIDIEYAVIDGELDIRQIEERLEQDEQGRSTIRGGIRICNATFSGKAYFSGATFSGGADFEGASFNKDTDFSGATFFSGEAGFRYATFSGKAYFSGATFSGGADFEGASFNEWASFNEASFNKGTYFFGATFSGETTFGNAAFSGKVYFSEATFLFGIPPDFSGVRISENVEVSGLSLSTFLPFLRAEETIVREIEFPPEYHQAGVGILSYFAKFVQQRYSDIPVKVKIEQDGLTVRMVIETREGAREEVERTLEEYGIIVIGQAQPEEFLDDKFQILELKQELRLAKARIEGLNDILRLQDAHYQDMASLAREALRRELPAQTVSISPIIQVHASSLVEAGHPEAAKAFKRVTESVAGSQEVDPKRRAQALELLEELSKQANLSPEKREKPGALKSMVGTLASIMGTAGSLAGVWSTWGDAIRAVLGF